MNDYIFLMHNDAPDDGRHRDGSEWASYLTKLREAGVFQGGRSIGEGICATKAATAPNLTRHLSGYVRVKAESLSEAQKLVVGNPVYEAGGTVEIRELPRD